MAKITLIYNAQLLDENTDGPGAILIEDKQIRSIFQGYFTSLETVTDFARSVLKEDGYSPSEKIEFYNAQGLTVTPAFIDMHVHLRYPGQTQKEDLESGLKAAIAGGVGTVVAMPNTKPVVSSYEMALQIEKEAAALGLAHVFQTVSLTRDFGGEDTSHLDKIERANIPVITEDGKDVLSSALMLEAMTKVAKKGIIVSCHSEDMTLGMMAFPYRQNALKIMKENGLSAWGAGDITNIDKKAISKIDKDLTAANNYLALAEDVATVRNIMLARQADCHVHIAHVSTKKSIDAVREGKKLAENLFKKHNENNKNKSCNFTVTCEVTPHHLALTGTEEPMIRALVNPPLRPESDRLALIEALRDGTADVISTDHAPHTMDDKAAGSPGFTGIETSYAVCNTVLVKQNDLHPRRLSQLMSANPARILGLNKGLLKPGYDADLTLLNPDEEWTVCAKDFFSKGKATPFEGKKLTGKVHTVFIDGKMVFER